MRAPLHPGDTTCLSSTVLIQLLFGHDVLGVPSRAWRYTAESSPSSNAPCNWLALSSALLSPDEDAVIRPGPVYRLDKGPSFSNRVLKPGFARSPAGAPANPSTAASPRTLAGRQRVDARIRARDGRIGERTGHDEPRGHASEMLILQSCFGEGGHFPRFEARAASR